ncbi:MBL fold metallo-hydrolase [Tuberibacillus sp. Marseille-P3662]|uniref:MBL fold metallo-hydrolase n=1 Tax=Tuberibacillus sp. Marseille-P3662 TaxID=1965358 RepID=UPI000A1CEE8E|nr:MBL fold metallo-hydrolase [Tuberibacillus sp. Marseille-P3662]
MKLTVVGFWGGYPGAGEATTGYLLQHEGFNLLIDCGSAVLSQLQYYIAPTDLDAVIVSHYHNDHVADIGPLHFARLVQSYLHDDPLPVLPIYGHQEAPKSFKQLDFHNIAQAVPYDIQKPLDIGPFHFDFIKTKHPVPCAAMRITDGSSVLVFTADTAYFNDLVPFAQDADLLISECNFYKGQDGAKAGHMTSEEAGQLAEKSEAKQLLLTHLPHYGEHQNLVVEATDVYHGTIALAASGWTWEF